MRSSLLCLSALFIFVVTFVYGQEEQYYDEQYANDNLYHNYAAKEQEKDVGNQGTPWVKLAAVGAAGWMMGGKFHSSRSAKKLTAKHKEDTKAFYTQYYNDVYTLKENNVQLVEALEQMGVSVKTQ